MDINKKTKNLENKLVDDVKYENFYKVNILLENEIKFIEIQYIISVQELDIHYENNFLDDLNHVINIDNEDEIH